MTNIEFINCYSIFVAHYFLEIIMSNSALFLVVLITAIFMVVAALLIAWWLAPHSQNPLKGEPYECGIPTRGASWTQFKAGYYLFAILFLVFDVETVLLFPWAVIMKDLGAQGLMCVAFFFVILTLGLAYAWKKGVLKWK
jgi:NADH-quinone oxidoreductase subunit A